MLNPMRLPPSVQLGGTLRLDCVDHPSPAGDHLRFRGVTDWTWFATNITTPGLLLAAGIFGFRTPAIAVNARCDQRATGLHGG